MRSRNDKLENHLAEAIEKLKSYHQSGAALAPAAGAGAGAAPLAKLEDVAAELEEQRELANNRLAELDRLHRQHRDALKDVEKLKMDVSILTLYSYNQCMFIVSLTPDFFTKVGLWLHAARLHEQPCD